MTRKAVFSDEVKLRRARIATDKRNREIAQVTIPGLPVDADPPILRRKVLKADVGFAKALEEFRDLLVERDPFAETVRENWNGMFPNSPMKPGSYENNTLILNVPNSSLLFASRPKLPAIKRKLLALAGAPKKLKLILQIKSIAMKMLLAAISCIAFGSFAAEDANENLDELGVTPKYRVQLNGDFDSSGEVKPEWSNPKQLKSIDWVKSRSGEKGAATLSAKIGTGFGNLDLGNEWTIVTVSRGVEAANSIVWTIGTSKARGSDVLGLVGTGSGGIKLMSWHGNSTEQKLIAVRDVPNYAKQFHCYAVVKHEGGGIELYVDGRQAGEAGDFNAHLSSQISFGSESWKAPENLANGDGTAIDEFRVYDSALSEVQLLQVANGNRPWPEGLPVPRSKVSAFIDTNSVLRLGYEIPESIVVGEGGEKRLYAKGVLAQCGIGGAKSFELRDGGAFALGGMGFVFDSNYAKGETNEIVFAGGAFGAFEPTFIKSAAPIRLSGSVRIITREKLIVRSSFDGDGTLIKTGASYLGLQYPNPNAKGRLVVENGMLLLGAAASWAGTVELKSGTTLKCPSRSAIGKLIVAPGANVLETGLTGRGDLSATVFPQPATAYDANKIQKEKIGRGTYAFRSSENEVWVSWRYLSGDAMKTAFNVYCDGTKLNPSPIRDVTYFIDKRPWTGKMRSYEVKGVLENGSEVTYRVGGRWLLKGSSKVGYNEILLTPPPDSVHFDGTKVGHFPCDTTIGDLDGDGNYELVIIWWPTDGADNSSWHQTGETWLEGVKLDGSDRSLWKINLGKNIRSGSHYTPVMVMDFDGDGKAEVVCRTSDGTVDGAKKVLGDAKADWRGKSPHILWAREFVTVFDGETGKALDSVPFKPAVLSDPAKIAARDEKAINREWSSRNPGNQAFRFLSAVGYLDGVHPSVVMCRGYYSRTCMTAYDWDGKHLKERWYFCSDDKRWWGYGGQGFHNLRVGDVDFDGKDEIVYGHMCVDHDGQGLWTTGYGHGDAMHLIQASPETRGLQVWTCHEASPYGVSLIDAQSGRTLLRRVGPQDTGSCNALDIDPEGPGVELFSGTHCGIFSASTYRQYANPKPKPVSNYYATLRFGIWWHGDMRRSAYSGGDAINDYSLKQRSITEVFRGDGGTESNHGTKGCPCLIADLFGDWREELLLRRKDSRAIRIYMSAEPTPYRFHTFLEDPVYRISVATQNDGYNVPTDPGFYFGPELLGHDIVFRGTLLK